MKRIHECALVKDGNKRVGYFICELGDLATSYVLKMPWSYKTLDEFFELVKSNQVQYLKISGDRIIAQYTDEERLQLRQTGVSDEYMNVCEKEYFERDLTFEYKHIRAAVNGNAIAASCGEIAVILGKPILSVYLYGNKQNRDSLLMQIAVADNTGFFRGLLAMCNLGNDLFTNFALPLESVDLFSSIGQKFNVMIKTSVLQKSLNDLNTNGTRVGWNSNIGVYSDSDGLKYTISVLNGLTSKTEKRLNLSN